jgi:pimeloyl-ACP methyl ester carboxylesterase
MKKLSKWARKLLVGLVVCTGLYLVVALLLSFWPEPDFQMMSGVSADQFDAAGLSREQVYDFEEHHFEMRDGTRLFARRFVADSDTTFVIIHGVTAESSQLNRSAGMIRESSGGEVFAIDLRGHGSSEGDPGDVDYIGQYEDDVTDVVAQIQSDNPGGNVILAGHSMGGGIAQRYAMKADAPTVDGYLLFAPLLGTGAPTMPTESVEQTGPDQPVYMELHIPRIIGLLMLNGFGITGLNSLPTMLFNPAMKLQVSEYSFRAMVSTAPQDFVAGLSAITSPLLVIVGESDETFLADEFEPVVNTYTDGSLVLVTGESHNGITHNPAAIAAMQRWLEGI